MHVINSKQQDTKSEIDQIKSRKQEDIKLKGILRESTSM